MSKWLTRKMMTQSVVSATTVAALVAIVEAGSKWRR